MTPTTSEREAFEAWAKNRLNLVTVPDGRYLDPDASIAWSAWNAAALTREQREGCVCGNPSATNTVHRTDGPCYQQEAPGAVWMAEVCEAAAQAMESNGLANRTMRLREVAATLRTTPPAPVDVRDVEEAMVERLAKHIVQQESRNCSTLDEALHHQSKWRRAIPEARAALNVALLDGQPAGVVIDDAMVERAHAAYKGGVPSEVGRQMMRAALQAALGGGGGRG